MAAERLSATIDRIMAQFTASRFAPIYRDLLRLKPDAAALLVTLATAPDSRAPELFERAISNLVDNALKYGIAPNAVGPDILITGAIVGSEVVITVADRGPGVPEGDRDRVIGRFVRLDESRSKPGNGLGLSLAAGVMKLHGGRLVLEDNEPGLKAKLVLPRAEAPRNRLVPEQSKSLVQ